MLLNYNNSVIASIKTRTFSPEWTNIMSLCNYYDELINIILILLIISLSSPTPLRFSTKIHKYPLSIKKILNKCKGLHKNSIYK